MTASNEPLAESSPAHAFRDDVIRGLESTPKRIAPKYFYDARGARLFDAICRTPEYYLTRVECGLLQTIGVELAQKAGRGRVVMEPGSGSSHKFGLLAEALRPALYAPVEICAPALQLAVERLRREFPWLPLLPLGADFEKTSPALPARGRRLIFFPGSTIGNFEPREAIAFLRRLAAIAGHQGGLLIGVDRKKERALLEGAYNDGAGVTAAFNLNLLARFNRELGADFDLNAFEHRAFFAAEEGRVEMHLVSRRAQRVRMGDRVIRFSAGESIHTENCYKYTPDEFSRLALRGGWLPVETWSDAAQLFGVHYLKVAEDVTL